MHYNDQFLVQTLEALPRFENRYEQLQCVNARAGVIRGCFSVVFKARDIVQGKDVALKFYSLNPAAYNDTYRRDAFLREHDILGALFGKDRCLQLEGALTQYQLDIQVPGGATIKFPCQYFATEWVEEEIDTYFHATGAYEAMAKLHLLNNIALSVEALHRHSIFHRDLKPDNVRARLASAGLGPVVAIDLGTAAQYTSAQLRGVYGHSVGAPAYASAEAHVGLAGHRDLAPTTDVYAVGCLLFELFNPSIFITALQQKNPHYQTILMAMQGFLANARTESEKLAAWRQAISRHGHSIIAVDIDGMGSSAPPGIAALLNEILLNLTHVDYSKRSTARLEWARKRIWSAIRFLGNERIYQLKLAQARKLRALRKKAIADKHAKALALKKASA